MEKIKSNKGGTVPPDLDESDLALYAEIQKIEAQLRKEERSKRA